MVIWALLGLQVYFVHAFASCRFTRRTAFVPCASTTDKPIDAPAASSPSFTFTSPPMPVFMEDTDAYGVKYYANYLLTYERSLHQAQLQNPDDFLLSTTDWSIVKVDSIKFKRAPLLGSILLIHGIIDAEQSNEMYQTWDLSMTCPDGATFYSTASGVRIQSMEQEPFKVMHLDNLLASSFTNNTMTTHAANTFTTFRDECDPHLPYHLPLCTALKLFERGRTDWIGGPSVLANLRTDHCVAYVVTSITNLSLVSYHNNNDRGNTPSTQPILPGNCPVIVHLEFCAKRNGRMVESYQTLERQDTCVTMAQACVTLLALDSRTWKPIKQLPQCFLQKFEN
jgi:acyl-CoA thioesterase FadM